MSQEPSPVLLDAADSQIASGKEAHDMVHDHGRGASREAIQAIKAISSNLESSTMEGTLSPLYDLNVHPPHLQDSPHNVLATENHDEPCVTTTAHDTTKHLVGAVNGNHEPNQGKTPNESIGTGFNICLYNNILI